MPHPRTRRWPAWRSALLLVLLGTPFAGTAGAAAPPDAAEVAEVAAYAERVMREAVPDPDGPGLAVLVARGEEILYRGARGRASIELGVALSPDHVMRIGSVTKQFAAAALLKLVDEGRAALDDPLARYLPDYPNAQAITLHQLLDHTAGIANYTDLPGYMDAPIRRDLTTAELVAVFAHEKPDFAPGEKWAYSNSGYVLVGAVIEAITGKPWHAYLTEAVLAPTGLADTRYGADAAVIDGFATGYSLAGGRLARAQAISMTQPHAAGALVSTLEDLWRWNLALHRGRVLSEASYRRMITPAGAAAKADAPYGYGIARGTLRGRTTLSHDGGIPGFLSKLSWLPEQQLTVVSLRNADGAPVPPAERRIAAFALGDPYPDPAPVAIAEDALCALEGVYRKDETDSRVLRVVDGALTSQREGGRPYRLIAVAGGRFVFEGSLSYLEPQRDRRGRVTGLVFHPEGEAGERWRRSGDLPPGRVAIELPRAALERLAGDYASPQLAIKVFLDEAGVLHAQVPGQPAFALKAESAERLFIAEVDATLTFDAGPGPAARVTLKQGPAEIPLERKQP
ncbi:MAG TPA: serine hydrolase domain-containing protein [Dokdonella sp.]|uniref:serine hydrolase domain-containing protein n=1 Tax=Dokdonella sp. TaxID=2291710 RepID=UPI002CF00D2A|nr:serine hydrolase domain-containing protein [Dokdonella sp.]HUD43481.1 serine hydrolase domain-containing protein [Dokdonella sp.]